MPLIYRGKKVIPAPLFSSTRERARSRSGEPLGWKSSVTIRGKLTADKGSPDSAGVFWDASGYPPDEVIASDNRLQSILAKQRALEELFAADNGLLEVVSPGGGGPVSFVLRNARVDFAEGNWFNTCDYTITAEVDDPEDEPPVDSAGEAWNVETLDEKLGTYRLTHSVQASARSRYDVTGALVQKGWEYARDYVTQTVGLGLKPARMEQAGASLQAFNYLRSFQLDEIEGTYSATETWICYNPGGEPPATEEFTVNARRDESGRNTVSVEGTITGFEVKDNSTFAVVSSRWANALAKWTSYVSGNLYSRAQTVSGVTLHPVPVNQSSGFNQNAGTVTYNYEFNDRPTTSYPGVRSETVTVTDNHPSDVFASLPVLGRALGPILQSIGTVTARKRSISIEMLMTAASQAYTPLAPDTAALVLALRPAGSAVFLDQDVETWTPLTGRYSRQTSFTWEA